MEREVPGLAAREMEIRFMRIGVDVDSITDTDLMRMQAVFQNKTVLYLDSVSAVRRKKSFSC